MSGDFLSRATESAGLPPVYVLAFSAASTSLLTAIIFGPPNLINRSASRVRPVVQLALFALAIHCAVDDVRRMHRCVTDPSDASRWERANGVITIWISSTNLLKGYAMQGVFNLHHKVILWSAAHGVEGSSSLRPPDTMGTVASMLYFFFAVCYIYPSAMIVIFSMPAALAYCYVFAPVYLLLEYLSREPMAWLIERARRAPDSPVQLETQVELSDEQQAAALASIGSIVNPYEREHRVFLALGAPLFAWQTFFYWPLLAPLFSFVSVCNARLVCGVGYWGALRTTFGERSMRSWLAAIAGDLAAGVQAGYLLL